MTVEEIEKYIAEFGNDIFRFCCYLTGNRDKGEELYQDTFLKALEIRKKIPPENAGKFLAGVAANLWKNQWRKEKRRKRIAAPVELNEMEPGMPQTSDMLEDFVRQETDDLVKRIVNTLPENYRIVVLLHYSADLTAAEIAEYLHISKGTVTSRLSRAREQIKKGLEASGYER
jgi:RNA polymerase sigma-70 factor (ECF subfamily)